MSPEALTRWTIRLALCGYAASIAAGLVRCQKSGFRWKNSGYSQKAGGLRARFPGGFARSAWTFGCVLLWIHVVCAFAFYHHWSHRAAYEQTARETAETVGIDWGGGIYFNYLMLGLWSFDAAWWWISELTYRARSVWWNRLLHGYFAFMIFNATVVFETGPIRWTALGTLGLLGVLALHRLQRAKIRSVMIALFAMALSGSLAAQDDGSRGRQGDLRSGSAARPGDRSQPSGERPQNHEPDWPHLRGPHYSGVSDEAGLADTWPAAGPPVLWKRDIGKGYSAFVAAGNRVFTQVQSLYGQYVVCLDGDTGATIWEHRYGWPYEGAGLYPGPRATPTLDAGRVYFAGTDGTIGCLQAHDGRLVWSVNVNQNFKGRGTDFGYSCSPLVEQNLVILPVGGRGASVVALHARDGTTAWQTGDEPASYCSAIPVTLAGRRCVVAFLQNALSLLELKSGKLLWELHFSEGYDEHSAFPLVDDPYLMIAVPFRGGATLYRFKAIAAGESPGEPQQSSAQVASVEPNGSVRDLFELESSVVWQTAELSNDVVSSVLMDGKVYGFNLRDPQSKLHRASRGDFKCLDMRTAKVLWSTDKVGHASLLVADGKLVLFNDKGELILARRSSRRYEELARTQVFSNDICWTAPALHRGKLYLRTQSGAACLFLGRPESLNAKQVETARPASEIAGTRPIDLTQLVGGEREHPFVRPDAREFGLWYGFSLIGVFGAAAGLAVGAWGAGRLCRKAPSRFSIFAVFWASALVFGVLGTPLCNRLYPEYIFTWPATLFAAYQLALISIVWAESQTDPDRKRARWRSRAAVLLLLAVCASYFHLCHRLSMGHEWVFLTGFFPAWPIAVSAARYLARSTRPLYCMIWFAVSFSAYFWSSAIYAFCQTALGR